MFQPFYFPVSSVWVFCVCLHPHQHLILSVLQVLTILVAPHRGFHLSIWWLLAPSIFSFACSALFLSPCHLWGWRLQFLLLHRKAWDLGLSVQWGQKQTLCTALLWQLNVVAQEKHLHVCFVCMVFTCLFTQDFPRASYTLSTKAQKWVWACRRTVTSKGMPLKYLTLPVSQTQLITNPLESPAHSQHSPSQLMELTS